MRLHPTKLHTILGYHHGCPMTYLFVMIFHFPMGPALTTTRSPAIARAHSSQVLTGSTDVHDPSSFCRPRPLFELFELGEFLGGFLWASESERFVYPPWFLGLFA